MDRLTALLHSHPKPVDTNGGTALRCIEACNECAASCTTCADACLMESGVQDLTSCIRLNLDCADICRVTSTLIARPSHADAPTLRAQLEACIAICRACADECAKHAEMMEHCRICAEVCRDCADACSRMASAIVP